MKNNLIYSHNHFKFFENILLKKRYEIIDTIKEQITLNKINDVLDVGTTSDEQNISSNLIVKNLNNASVFHSISDQKITSSFFKKILQKLGLNMGAINYEDCETAMDTISSKVYRQLPDYQNQAKTQLGQSITLFFTGNSSRIPETIVDSTNHDIEEQ